jgi:ATP-binding cassette, subfamily B, bacterial
MTAATPTAARTEEDVDTVPFRRVAGLFAPYRWLVAGVVLASAAQGLTSVASPFFLRGILDHALPERSLSLVVILSCAMLVSAVATAALGVLTTRLATIVGQHVMHDLRVGVYTHLQQMSLKFFTKARAGDLQSRLANDIGGVDNVVTTTASGTAQSALGGLAVAIAVVVMNWRLGLLCLVVVPLFLLFSLRLGRNRRQITRSRARKQAGLAALVEETLSVSGVLLTKTTGGQRTLVDRFTAESRRLSQTEVDLAMSGRWQMASRRALLTMIPAIVYLVAGIAAIEGSRSISIGTAVASASMLNRLIAPATTLQGIGTAYSTSMALFGRIFEVLDLPIDIPVKPGAQGLPAVRGDVSFSDVSFRYDETGPLTLEDISLAIPAGTTTALVGATGAGKTTLAYLIARLYDVSGGSVSIDGVDVRDLQSDALAGTVGLVAQDIYLFHDTVRENLRFAAPDATDDEVEAAARTAHIHDLIASLPDGYDTVVGARGHRFSGGERQRLAIARMVLRDPPILVLDEATSALDNATERSVQEALRTLSAGRTTVAIAHRLSTVRDADQIVVLDHGRIVERGTHQSLQQEGGKYAALLGALR